MKKIVFTITLFLNSITIFAQKIVTNKSNQKSNIKTIQKFHYLANQTPNGYDKGKLISNDFYKFDIKGEIIDNKLIGYGINGNKDATYKNEVDNRGRRIQSTKFDNLGKVESIIKYQYDTNDKLIKESKFDSNGNFISSEISKYNSKGLLSELISELQLSNGISITKHTYKYDEKDRKIQELWINKEGLVINTIIREYSQEKCTEITNFSAYGYSSKSKKIYDKYENLIEDFTYSKDDELKERTVRVFDQFNNITDLIEYDSKGKVTQHNKFKYKYDDNNNWIEKLEIYSSAPQLNSITERILSYY